MVIAMKRWPKVQLSWSKRCLVVVLIPKPDHGLLETVRDRILTPEGKLVSTQIELLAVQKALLISQQTSLEDAVILSDNLEAVRQ